MTSTVGSFDLNLTAISNTTNNSTGFAASVIGGVRDQGDLIGLAIAIALALALIFGVVFLAINFIPTLVGKIKGIRRA